MKGLFKKLIGAFLGITMAAGIGAGIYGGSRTEVIKTEAAADTGYTLVTMTAGTNGSACTVNGEDGIKVGTSKAGGDMLITVPSGSTGLRIYAAAWNGVTGLSLNITKTSGASNATISPTSASLTADTGISNNSPFTLAGSKSNFKFDFTLSNITANTVYKFTGSSAKRFVVWSAQVVASVPIQNYTITYNANGGTGTMENTVDPAPTVAACTFTNTGYIFSRWNTQADGNGTDYAVGSTASSDLTLYAIWETAPLPTHAGTQADPYTVEDARKAIDANTGLTNVYVKGIVSRLFGSSPSVTQNGEISYYISDNGSNINEVEAYKGKSFNGNSFTSIDEIQVGDTVVIKGTLLKYNSTYELGEGNELISLIRPASTGVSKTITELTTANNWTVSAGSDIGDIITSFALDSVITISTTGEANCGTIWGTTTNDWRLYQNKSGNVIATAATDYIIDSVTYTYNQSNSGTLKDGNAQVSSGSLVTVNASSKELTVGNTGSATNGQVKITAISVKYHSTIETETAETFATTFLASMTCDSTGATAPVFTKTWAELKTAYQALPGEEQDILEFASANENGTTIEQAMARYNYLVAKYGYENFIGRTIPSLSNRMNMVDNNQVIIMTVAIIVILSLTATGTVIFVRKRKLNK